jgi:hypothetical protein
MNKYFRYFLISLLSILGLIGLAFVLIYQNIETLQKYALDELNKNLKAPLTTKEVSVSIFSTFPMVSLEFKEVNIIDPLCKNSSLIEAQRLYLGFNFYDVINKKYKVQLIELDSGSINMYVDKKGVKNFDILKSQPESKEKLNTSEAFSFQLNKVGLNRIRINYEDKSALTHLDVFAKEAEIHGQFTEKEFEMEVKLSGLCQQMKFGTLALFKQKTLNLNLAFQVNNITNNYFIKRGELGINTLFLHLTGDMKLEPKKSNYNLVFSTEKITIQDLISIMPFEVPSHIKSYASQGKVYFKGKYAGTQSKQTNPQLIVDFGIEEGQLIEPETGIKIENINLKGSYKGNNDLSKSTLNIPSLNAQFSGSQIRGNLQLTNLLHPALFAELNGNADLQTLHDFLKFEDVKSINGNLEFTLTVKGSQKDSTWIWDSNFSQGIFKMEIPELTLTYINKPFNKVELVAGLSGSNLSIDKLTFQIGESDFDLNGKFPTFLSAFGEQKDLFQGNLNLKCNLLNSNDLLIYNASDPKENDDASFQYKIGLNLIANKFVYNNFIAANLSCKTILVPNKTEIPYFSLQTCSGSFAGEASWQMIPEGYVLKANHQATHIDLSQLLLSFKDFGQTEITNKHLKGFLSAQTDMIVYFDSKMNVIHNKILLVSTMNIKQGELIDYKPLLGLSRFADVSELKHLKFSELNNTLTIKNNVISIPEMVIKTNAISLSLSGKHAFDNMVNYKVKLALSQLLYKKRKIQPNEFGEEDPVSKNWTIYVNIDGPLSNLKYSFDRKGSSVQLKDEVKKEKENIKEILKQEFQIKKDTSLKKVETNNNNPDELEFEEE